MKQVKVICVYFLIASSLIFLLSRCSGTLGTIQKYQFDVPERVVKERIKDLIAKYPNLVPKNEWEAASIETQKALNFLEFIFIYLDTKPNEMLNLDFVPNIKFVPNQIQDTSACIISLTATSRYNPKCKCIYMYRDDDLNDEEKEKVKRKFEYYILSNLKLKYKRVSPY
jgi:hypothetical protein